MTGKEVLDLVMGRCNRTSPEFRALVLQEMIAVQQDRLEKRGALPHWLKSERADAITEINEPRLAFPSDFLREAEDMNLMYVNEEGDEIDLAKLSWDRALAHYDDTATGPPDVYTIRGNYIHLRPTPDAEYTVRFAAYYARQQAVQDSAEFTNKWTIEAPGLLVGLTGMVMASMYIKDNELALAFAGVAKDANKELDDAITAFEEANRDRRMG
jgi:hypothetical protein